jgi:hypothetical protein
LKDLPTRRLRRVLLAVALAAAAIGAASLPWRSGPAASTPRVVSAVRATGSLSAGAAGTPFSLPAGVPIGGFARIAYGSEGIAAPLGVRALVLSSPGCAVALASAEILLVPEDLEEAVAARVADLGLAGMVLAATHTHAGPGGYWDHALGERLATGPYDPAVRESIVAATADAIRRAFLARAPARLAVARGAADDLARSRSGGLEDAPITALRLDRPDGTPVAELTVFAAHPTILGKSNRDLSGDWPGRFLAGGTRGLRLLLQGAIGDQSVDGGATARPDAYAAALSARLDELEFGAPDAAPALGFAAAEVALPVPRPGAAPAILRPAAGNLAAPLLPTTARVEALRLGPALLVAVPGEPVARVAADWRKVLPAGAAIVSLAGGYVGYVEAPDRMRDGAGETIRTHYGPDLAPRLGEGARAAAEAVDGVGLAGTSPGPRP